MPRFRQIPEILKQMKEKESIRNLGIVAHIDHGKTTLTDILIAGAGLLPSVMVGSARVLDYLEDEQKRGITMKTANMSLLCRREDHFVVINLVDTPGHVDFTGKVTRAMRSVDGVIVVVDAVEEIMPQTEIVIRQSLEERVRPLLFINKVDRLVTELRLNPKQIQEKFTRIIERFNDLIEVYGEPTLTHDWKADSTKNNVGFGSALHGWGFTMDISRRKDLKFNEITEMYTNGKQEKIQEILPLHKAIIEIVDEYVPNPIEAQKYRIEKIWKGSPSSKVGVALRNCDEKGPTIFYITNMKIEPDLGQIAIGRLFSGVLKTGQKMYLVNAKSETEIQQVYIQMGAFREPIEQAIAGSSFAIVASGPLEAGETLVDPKQKKIFAPFETIKYVSDPVVTVAVEPKSSKALERLVEAMNNIAREDPNIAASVNRETGEFLLSGMGEMHLEVALKSLRNYLDDTELVSSSPRVVYRETATKEGKTVAARSPNKQNEFSLQVKPLKQDTTESTKHKDAENNENILAIDKHNNILLSSRKEIEQAKRIINYLRSGFFFACKAGPLCGEPMRDVQAELLEIRLGSKVEDPNPDEIMRGIGKAIFGSFLSTNPRILEPICKIVISSPAELAGECSRIISNRKGRVTTFENKGIFTTIEGFIPVAGTFGLTEELRSKTSGRAIWQSVFSHWEKVPEREETKIIRELRIRKGLPLEIPKPDRFSEE